MLADQFVLEPMVAEQFVLEPMVAFGFKLVWLELFVQALW